MKSATFTSNEQQVHLLASDYQEILIPENSELTRGEVLFPDLFIYSPVWTVRAEWV